jgi:hypothetical protein
VFALAIVIEHCTELSKKFCYSQWLTGGFCKRRLLPSARRTVAIGRGVMNIIYAQGKDEHS